MKVCTILLLIASVNNAFVIPRCASTSRALVTALSSTEDDLLAEAAKLRKRAQELRATLPEEKEKAESSSSLDSKWMVESDSSGVGYRLELDIGREEGTWMDPRWGASGRRISLTLDVLFSDLPADKETEEKMVKDNFGGKSSRVCLLETAPAARLRNGFDKMKCTGGAYRVDSGGNGQQTARFYIPVEGTPERGSSYGDVSVPEGRLYFSLPCFRSVSNLSTKEGIVTVREVGWHTGWRREESRIIGTVYATPIEKAIKRDTF